MVKFTDKKGREIDIEVDYANACAYHDGKQIGDVLTTGPREVDQRVPDLPPKITGWEVQPDFRGAGICTEMIRLLADEWGPLEPPEKDAGIGDVNALTSDGMAIARKCQDLGFVLPFEDE